MCTRSYGHELIQGFGHKGGNRTCDGRCHRGSQDAEISGPYLPPGFGLELDVGGGYGEARMAEKGAGGPPRASGIEGSRGEGSRKCFGIRADGRSARLEVNDRNN